MDWMQALTTLAGAAGGAATAALLLMRRASATKTEFVADQVERGLLQALVRERDELRASYADLQASRQQCASSLARAHAEKDALMLELRQQEEQFASFQRKLARMYPETRQFMDSNVMPVEGFPPRAP